jgi:hypothetical protein
MDYLLLDGDTAQFLPSFGPAIVEVRPGALQGSGPAKCNGKPVCVEGDEVRLEVPDCAYTSGLFSTAGMGTLKIAGLASNQVAQHSKSGGKKMLLKGTTFQAEFEVTISATDSNGVPDSMNQYPGGSGQFITTNTKHKGT